MSFPQRIKEQVLIASGRSCCLCHKFCGTKIEVHHIKPVSEGGKDIVENAITLCLECHVEVRSYNPKHPKGNKFTESELRRHRDNWYKKVAGNIGLANKESVIETDKLVYESIVGFLPWDPVVNFLESHDFASPFQHAKIFRFHDFVYRSLNPSFEFIDPDLEELRANLCQKICKFSDIVSVETCPTKFDRYTQSVPEDSDDLRKVGDKINEAANDVVGAYRNLIRTATRKLGILPQNMGIEENTTVSKGK